MEQESWAKYARHIDVINELLDGVPDINLRSQIRQELIDANTVLIELQKLWALLMLESKL